MPALRTELRNRLEKTIIEARRIAEDGARSALETLSVHEPSARGHMDEQSRLLRRHLRARGKQLGDARDSAGRQEIIRLAHACAYEHWHRMLFARFLAENGLLIEPETGIPVSLDECREMAREAGIDPWSLAAGYAQKMLPQIFRLDDPLLSVSPAREKQNKLEALLSDLETEVFQASDSLGWSYQFWQTENKKRINASEVKIGADELAPVTQLFTEDYMVEFLLHNTLGAWWAGKIGPIKADTEEEARTQAALTARDGVPVISWTYLRFVQDETAKTWLPAAGIFDAWPKSASLIRLLDPCMGSGHFLVFALPLLVRLLIEEEKLSAQAAVVAVLKDNIHGLELDERCAQIAAFNVALTAWKLGGYQALPILNLACSGLAPSATEAEWMALAEDNDRFKRGMAHLHSLFKDAPVLGSLINPRAQGGNLIEAEFHELAPLLAAALAPSENQKSKFENDAVELAVIAQGLAKAAELLAGQFTLVITNVPYLGRGKQDEVLKDYCERIHPEAKADLSTCFVERCLDFCNDGSTTALVTPQSWLFQRAYSKLRKNLLEKTTWDVVARLGSNAFQDMNWWAAVTLLSIYSRLRPDKGHLIAGFDVGEVKDQTKKASLLSVKAHRLVPQPMQQMNPQCIISFDINHDVQMLYDLAKSTEGLSTGDGNRFLKSFWEIYYITDEWAFFHGTADETEAYSGLSEIIFWQMGVGELSQSNSARVQGHYSWGKNGVLLSRMNRLKCNLYFGTIYDKMAVVLVPNEEANLPALWAFCSSEDYHDAVRSVSQNVAVATAILAQVPFDLAHWQKVAAQKYPYGLPKPHSDDPTQWLFNGHPKGSDHPLHVAVARLLGYRWPRRTGSSFPDCPALGPDGLEKYADPDGILCIPPVRREEPAADCLRRLLAAAFDKEWKTDTEMELVRATGSDAGSLEEWLRNDFFQQHCGIFHQRPFIWHIWDGRRNDGFHALLNYHKLAGEAGVGRKTLELLTHSYLNEWIGKQREGIKRDMDGAEARLAAALELKTRLEAILEGEPPHDLFIRWKPLSRQPIGWEPDINDGVRLNIRPFLAKDIPGGRTGAGILRWKPNIKWDKDRGKEPLRPKEEYPWFWKGDEPTGIRVNDIHLAIRKKQSGRRN